MANTRRSTRQAATTTPKYNDDNSPSASEDAPKPNGTKSTRRKRAREDDVEVNDSQPPKKAAKATSKSKPTMTKPNTPTSDTNRDANGNQEVFWLLKAEPLPRYENGINVAFSIDDLFACTRPEPWSGVRNPQARNNMQAMRTGDLGFFYHSNAKPSGVAGILRVVEEAKVDETAFDSKDPYYDAKSERGKPKWYCVGVEFVRKFEEVVGLHEIKRYAGVGGELEGMQLVKNSRLSVSMVGKGEWEFVVGLAENKEKGKAEEENGEGT